MKSFSRILVAIDFSDNSDSALDYALTLATSFSAELLLVHVINEPVDLRGFYVPHVSFDQLEKEIEEGASKMMGEYCAEKLEKFSNYRTVIATGAPADELIAQAEKLDASLIVLGTHGRTGIDRILFGSTAERVVRAARCPVMTVRLETP